MPLKEIYGPEKDNYAISQFYNAVSQRLCQNGVPEYNELIEVISEQIQKAIDRVPVAKRAEFLIGNLANSFVTLYTNALGQIDPAELELTDARSSISVEGIERLFYIEPTCLSPTEEGNFYRANIEP